MCFLFNCCRVVETKNNEISLENENKYENENDGLNS